VHCRFQSVPCPLSLLGRIVFPVGFLDCNRCLYIHKYSLNLLTSIMKMEAVCTSETSAASRLHYIKSQASMFFTLTVVRNLNLINVYRIVVFCDVKSIFAMYGLTFQRNFCLQIQGTRVLIILRHENLRYHLSRRVFIPEEIIKTSINLNN
jgi:hypothetical protein